MFAARYEPGKKSLLETEIEQPKIGDYEVLLKIKAAGVCHSDLHVLDGDFPYPNAFTMGHEACGQLIQKGSKVGDEFKIGDLYAVHGPNPCGECDYCRSGRDNLCDSPSRQPIGLGTDGAYAEFLKVRSRNIIRVPDGVKPEVAAVATDAVLTPYHAIKTLAQVRAGQRVLIVGLGGLGINGVQVAHMLGAETIASDVRPEVLDLALDFGAYEAFHAEELLDKTRTNKFDVIVDFVGLPKTYENNFKLIKPGGTIVAVGLGSPQISMPLGTTAVGEVSVKGAFWGTSLELKELLKDISEGKLLPQVETQKMQDVNHWLEELRHGHIHSRLALIPK